MKFKFSSLIQNVNNILHFSNLSFIIYGGYNHKYFSDEKRKKYFSLSLKNTSIIIVDAFNHSNVNKYFYLVPTIISKILILAYYYKLFGYKMKDEIIDYLGINTNKQDDSKKFLDLFQDEINEKDKIELEMIEDRITRITMLYELNKKVKFSDKHMDYIAKGLDKYDKQHNLIVNIAVISTILTPFI